MSADDLATFWILFGKYGPNISIAVIRAEFFPAQPQASRRAAAEAVLAGAACRSTGIQTASSDRVGMTAKPGLVGDHQALVAAKAFAAHFPVAAALFRERRNGHGKSPNEFTSG